MGVEVSVSGEECESKSEWEPEGVSVTPLQTQGRGCDSPGISAGLCSW